MVRWLYALVVGAVVSGFALLLLTGEYIKDGPVLIALGRNHGVHEGDLFVVAGWVVAMLAVTALAVTSGRSDRNDG